MNQQTQKKTTPVTEKKREATDELSQPIGKKTTSSNVNAIPVLVGASNALVSLKALKASKASTALNGTVLNETVLNATGSNATVSNATELNGSNGSLGISNTSATKKSLLSKEGKAVTNKSDDYSNKRKRGETNKTPQPPIKKQATAESKAAKEAEKEENDVVIVEAVPEKETKDEDTKQQQQAEEEEAQAQAQAVQEANKEMAAIQAVEEVRVATELAKEDEEKRNTKAESKAAKEAEIIANEAQEEKANSKEREALRIAEAKVVEDTRIAAEKWQKEVVNEARKLKEALERRNRHAKSKKPPIRDRAASAAAIAKKISEVKKWKKPDWNNYPNLKALNNSLYGGKGSSKTKAATIESITSHLVGNVLISEYRTNGGTFTAAHAADPVTKKTAARVAKAAKAAKAARVASDEDEKECEQCKNPQRHVKHTCDRSQRLRKKQERAGMKTGHNGENIGRWTSHEHSLFLEGLQNYGKDWKKVADLIPFRTLKQTRTHAQKYLQSSSSSSSSSSNASKNKNKNQSTRIYKTAAAKAASPKELIQRSKHMKEIRKHLTSGLQTESSEKIDLKNYCIFVIDKQRSKKPCEQQRWFESRLPR